jgi:hypothetical protein
MRDEGRQKPPASRAVDEAVAAKSAAYYALRHWERALADGSITMEQAIEGVRLQRKAYQDACDVVPLTEKTCQLVTLGAQWVLWGEVTPNAARIAASIGVYAPELNDAA